MNILSIIKSITSYVHRIFSEENGNPSSRRLIGSALSIDFIINVHNSVSVSTKIINLIYQSKPIDAGVIAALSSNLSQIILALGIEAGLIAAFFSLTTYTSIVGKKKDPEAV